MRAVSLSLLVVVGVLAAPQFARCQESGGDDALDRLLKKVEEPARDPSQQGDQPRPAEVSEQDRDLDNLLRKLGESSDAPETGGKPEAAPPANPAEKPGENDERTPGLDGREKELDEHLEELTGRKRKPREGDDSKQQSDENSPLRGAIKRMEEVTKRLSDNDTGESTRREQEEIVKELDGILQQLRRQQNRMAMRSRQQGQGQQPAQGEGEQPNSTGAGVGASKPKSPTIGQMLGGRKDTWGDLPPALREELENVFKSDMLPSKSELIRRYYSAVARKSRRESRAPR